MHICTSVVTCTEHVLPFLAKPQKEKLKTYIEVLHGLTMYTQPILLVKTFGAMCSMVKL